MVTPFKLLLALIACLLMLGLILGMAFIPDDTHRFYQDVAAGGGDPARA